jgi:hypothetical protein
MQPPVLVVESSVVNWTDSYTDVELGRTATGEQIPGQLIDQTVAQLQRDLVLLSAEHFTGFASVERRTSPVGGRSEIPSGAIEVAWERGLAAGMTARWGRPIDAYGGRNLSETVSQAKGRVALDSVQFADMSPVSAGRRDFVLRHELGHAFGYGHTTVGPSFMFRQLLGVSARDSDAFKVFFQRPIGNKAPDIDPSGFAVNATA